ncbi:MAG: methyltransferase type 11 [Acidimicrobiales bacterium]|nr:MAG: methyltransferase type 11 [Acidimicrobiales bacterium]
MGEARYDTIGRNYARHRRTDPSWLAEIVDALDGAHRVLNVGAGAGSYEALAADVVALEPSRVMLDQRGADAAPAVQAFAEAVPFANDAFDATLGVLTMHHWTDRLAGLRELDRVAPRHVLTVYEPLEAHDFWLIDYFPETAESDMEVNAPTPATVAEVLDVVDVRTLWVTRDCPEGFAAASWARPHDYLDAERQQAISLLALADADVLARGTARLRDDLESGRWYDRYAHVIEAERADFGYRLVTAVRRGG